jgi:hypothetical protein
MKSEGNWKLPKPTRVNTSLLTRGGQKVYDTYLELFYESGWWWTINEEGFTLEDATLPLVFHAEGSSVLANRGLEIQNYGLSLVDAWSEGAVRNLYGSCNSPISNGLCTNGPDTLEGILNWLWGNSQSLQQRITGLHSENDGGDLQTQFQSNFNFANAKTVAYNFFHPDPSWTTGWAKDRPYGWGNDMEGKFLASYAANVNMVVWASGSSATDFYIPTGKGMK